MLACTLQSLPALGRGRRTPFAFSWKRFWHSLLRRATGVGVEVFSVRLAAGQELRLHDVAGWTVVCRSGAAWITQEADARDIFLEGGEGFALDRIGLALVCACRDTALSFRAPAGQGSIGAHDGCNVGVAPPTTDDQAHLTWLRSLYPECGPWNDPASYRRSGLL